MQEALGAIVQKDPAVAHVAMAIGGTGNPSNTGRMFITLKPRDQRDATADQVIARLQPQLAKVEGAAAVPAGGAGRDGRRTRGAHAVPVHAAGRRFRRAQRLGAEAARENEDTAGTARRRLRSGDRRHDAVARSSTATRRRATAYRRRPSTTRSTTRSASARSPSISRSSRAMK